jgi:two-component system, cell cycle response regulator
MDPIGIHSRRPLRLAQGIVFALLLAFALQALLWRGGRFDDLFNDWVYNGLIVSAGASCLVRAVVSPIDRLAWGLLAGAVGLWASAEITSTVYLAHLETPPYPSIADAMWLAFYPASYAALVLLVRGRIRGQRRSALWLDGIVAALTVAALVEVAVFRPVLEKTGGTSLETATDLAYPVGDILLLSLVIGVFAMTGWRPGRVWALIGAGLAAAVIADCIYVYKVAEGSYVEGTVLDALWPAALLLVGYAAWEPVGRAIEPKPPGLRLLVLPVLLAGCALGLLVYDHFRQIDHVALALVTLTMLAVLLRTALTFRENLQMLQFSRREAMTDSLTGLGNRRRLMTDLMRELDTATPANPVALVLYDLDGFKRYNDDYGHPAGDALLARMGRDLQVALGPWGQAYRLGGDEFCALVQLPPGGSDELLASTGAALTEHGRGFDVSSSHGMVLLPTEAQEPSLAMQIADQRLYGNKGTRRRQVANQQTRDVLLQVLHESQPDLHHRLRDVARLALAVGRRLELLPEELDDIARAAELHDVGKMAIPNEILNKPGPLDRAELGLIRRHTIVGERIISAAPSLSPVARVVRASHERWDGTGYPDGLAGEEIPVAARIIAACDAYHAMTSDRPYEAAVPPAAALAELRRCAGGQFDPRVVELLCEVVEGLEPEPPETAPTGGIPFDATIDPGMLGAPAEVDDL